MFAAETAAPMDPYAGIAIGVECAWPLPPISLRLPDSSTGLASSPLLPSPSTRKSPDVGEPFLDAHGSLHARARA